jgi:hypothetical protein
LPIKKTILSEKLPKDKFNVGKTYKEVPGKLKIHFVE